jgi:hypothetical protein
MGRKKILQKVGKKILSQHQNQNCQVDEIEGLQNSRRGSITTARPGRCSQFIYK